MSNHAQAMVFEQVNKPFVSQKFVLPALKEGEILVKTEYATICTSDLHTFFGRRTAHKHSILGHEIIGHIENIGGKPQDYYGEFLNPGDRITWAVYAHDAECQMSKKGYPQKSQKLFKYGHESISENCELNGGFATHCQLVKGSTVFKIPSQLSAEEAAPLNCTHATIAGAIRLAGNIKSKNVLVTGAGMLGLSACAMAKENEAQKVWITDVLKDRMKHALFFGADACIEADLTSSEKINLVNEKGGIDVIIETSGNPEATESAIEMLNIGGTIILVGAVFTQRNLSVNAEQIVRKLLTIKGLHNYMPQDLAYAINFLTKSSSKYPFKKLVGKSYALSNLQEAFSAGNSGKFYRIGINTLIK